MEFWPVVSAEVGEFEVFIVYLEGKPGPFHLSGLSLVLMEILERFCLLFSDAVVLRLVVKSLLDVSTAMHGAWRSYCSSSIESIFVGETSLISSEFVNVESLLGLLHSMSPSCYLLFFLSARYDLVAGTLGYSGER